MADDAKPTPRVVRRGSTPTQEAQLLQEVIAEAEIFEGTLSTGRRIALREMTAGDLLYMEKALGNLGEMERSLKLAARISIGDGKVSFEDLSRLKMKDLKVVTDLLGQAGDADGDMDEYPNE